MIELSLILRNSDDLYALIPLFERLGVSWKKNPGKSHDIEEYQRIISLGGNTEYFGDPVEWQRAVREDRPLPYRGRNETD